MGPSSLASLPSIATEAYAPIPLVGIDEGVPAGVQTVRASCSETGAGIAFFNEGTLVLEVHPTG